MCNRVVHANEDYPGAVYVGRAFGGHEASPFGNPFRLRHGASVQERRRSVEQYAEYLRNRPDLIRQLPELRNAPLACWCRKSWHHREPGNLCHADVLAKWLATYDDETLRNWPDA